MDRMQEDRIILIWLWADGLVPVLHSSMLEVYCCLLWLGNKKKDKFRDYNWYTGIPVIYD